MTSVLNKIISSVIIISAAYGNQSLANENSQGVKNIDQAPLTSTEIPVKAEVPAKSNAAHWYVFGLGLGLGVGGAVSWKFHQTWTGKFQNNREGWFGSDTYAGGADKIGHFYTDYLVVRGFHDIYKKHGYSDNESIVNGLLGSMLTRTIMEVADGLTTFKYSSEDLIANMSGSLVSAALLASPEFDRAFGFSWTYAPSTEKLRGEVDAASIDNDYNGSIYHMDIKLKGLRMLVAKGYKGMRAADNYTLGISYFTRGYDREREVKHRYLGLTLGANLDEIIASNGAESWTMTRTLTKYFKLPFSFGGVYYDLDQHKVGVRYGLNYFY